MNSAGDGAKAGRREWAGLAVLMLPVLLISVTVTVLFFALPSLTAELAPSGAQQLWIVDIYAFLLAGLLIPMGNLGDRIGRRRLLLLGAAAFGATSAAAAYAPTAELLIAARALQGAAAATLMPPTLALIRTMFTRARQLQAAIAVWASVFTLGSVVGPIIGGWLLEQFWWGAVFLINVPVMAVLLVLGPLLLPEYRDPEPGRFDLVSAAWVLLAALPAVYAVKKAAEQDLTAPTLAAALLGVLFAVLFVRRQQRLDAPMLDLALFRSAAFSVSLITAALAVFALVGTFYFITQYLMSVLGMRPLTAGLMTLPTAVSSVTGSMLGAALTRWFRPGHVIGSGMLLGAAGFVLIARLDTAVDLPLLFAGLLLLGWGIGSVQALASNMVVSSAPPEKAGSASGLFESATEFGQALGAAVLGSIGVAVFRSALAGGLPAGLSAEQGAAASETLGGALAVAAELAGGTGAALAEAARSAYVGGMQTAAWAGAAIMLVMGVLAFINLRHARVGEQAPPEPAAGAAR
ncbi:MFS transporter [Nocardiopsis composta]|uniref:DHA2 family multidrug resistance protein-like MFS transporter n=1 Tax=Nocardiopsis composta TaxID=157465 RepID=A0A7W8QJX7_9ACTN|nr:MFS transporter [Nocardiopsis composta]MBB5431178.1 DHA2 family multidrug resistance protein-like MFS transporter [Nocardiopsis composta]